MNVSDEKSRISVRMERSSSSASKSRRTLCAEVVEFAVDAHNQPIAIADGLQHKKYLLFFCAGGFAI